MKHILLALTALALVGLVVYYFAHRADAPSATELTITEEAAMTSTKKPTLSPIEHASFVLTWGDTVMYNDPVGEADDYLAYGKPGLIVLTHSHPDHLDTALLEIVAGDAPIVAPEEVFEKLPESLRDQTTIMANDETKTVAGITLTAVPMYNTTPEKSNFHVKGVGNGYVMERDGFRIYNASDTENTPEFRAQTDIDIALVPMNEPFTMSVTDAVAGVVAMAPKQVYPYHYRGRDGMSDVEAFKNQVEAANPEINVILANWYPNAEATGE